MLPSCVLFFGLNFFQTWFAANLAQPQKRIIMNAFKYIRRSVAISSLMFIPGLEAVSRADTVVVTPTNLNGWALATTDDNGDPSSSGTAAFVNGPATPPLGTGSVNLATAMDGGAAGIGTAGLDGLPLSAITALSYSTYMSNNLPAGQQFPYIALSFSTDGSDSAASYDNIVFEPPYQTASTGNPSLPDQGATQLDTWQSWNAEEGGWWDGNVGNAGTGVESLAYYVSQYPDATIADYSITEPGSPLLGLEFQVGFADPATAYDGNVDAITIGINGANTTYNMEVPEPASTGLLLVGGAAALMRRRRRRLA
jgi:hypothetical protein